MKEHVEEIADRKGVNRDDLYGIGRSMSVNANQKDTILLNARNEVSSIVYKDGQDSSFASIVSIFSHFLKQGLSLEEVMDDPAFRVYTIIEIPEYFMEDWIVRGVDEKANGVYYHASEEETEGIAKYVPVIKENDE